jgi:hypothetical protein
LKSKEVKTRSILAESSKKGCVYANNDYDDKRADKSLAL